MLDDAVTSYGMETSAKKSKTVTVGKSVDIPSYEVSLKYKLKIFLYGCESWTLSVKLEKKIHAFEMKCYRCLLGIPYTAHKTNT